MNLLIVNADDFGYSAGINYGIIDAYQNGILSSTTLMANMSGFKQATVLAKENPGLGIGVHLTLTCGSPVKENVKSLVEADGKFHKLSFYEKGFSVDLDELYDEWKAQIDTVIAGGIKPTHLDSHHHVNSIQPLTTVFERLAKEYDLPVRHNYEVAEDFVTTRRFFNFLDTLGRDKEIWKPMTIRNLVDDVKTFGTVEAMTHPGYVDAVVLDNSSLNDNRAYQLRELQQESYQKLLKDNEITLGTYADL